MIRTPPGSKGLHPSGSHLPDVDANQHWEWDRTLATAEPGRRYRVTSAVFSLVQERCHDVGCVEGDELTCVENDQDGVTFSNSAERIIYFERAYAWLVKVEPV
jgi:hypothetical protein